MERFQQLWGRVSSWVVPLAIFVLGSIDIAQNGSISSEGAQASFPGQAWEHYVFLLLSTLPLYWRKRYPVAVLWTTIAVTIAWFFALFPIAAQPPLEPALSMMVSLYTLARETDGRQLIVGTIGACCGALGIFTAELIGGSGIGNVFGALLIFSLSWIVGRIAHQHFSTAVSQEQRAELLQNDQEARMAEAAAQERARIARELHDVVAHSLSTIVVQAAAERRVLDDDNSATRAVLESIEVTGRQAMVELRRLLGVLRTDDSISLRSPQPGLHLLPQLVQQLGDSGIEVVVSTEGNSQAIPSGVDLSAYRIVQESLTNVLKHSGATQATVRIRSHRQSVEIEVTDNGGGTGVDASEAGFGLVGMRERANVYGGTVEAGPDTTGGGYRVRAVLPLEAGEQVQALT